MTLMFLFTSERAQFCLDASYEFSIWGILTLAFGALFVFRHGRGTSKKKFTAICPWPRLRSAEGREQNEYRFRCCVGMRVPREKPFKPGHPHPPKQLRPQFQPVP